MSQLIRVKLNFDMLLVLVVETVNHQSLDLHPSCFSFLTNFTSALFKENATAQKPIKVSRMILLFFLSNNITY